MRRKLAVLAVLIAMFTSVLSFVGNTASACPIFMTPVLDRCSEDSRDSFKDLIENIDW